MADVTVSKDALQQMEKAILGIQGCVEGGDEEDLKHYINHIRLFLNLQFKNTKISELWLVKNPIDGYFFGARVFPDIDETNGIVKDIIAERKVSEKRTKQYIMELDSKLFYDKTLNATPREIMAVILHEVGHKLDENNPTLIKAASLYVANTLKKSSTLIIRKDNKWQTIMWNPIFYVLGQSYLLNAMNSRETMADSFAVKHGYGPEIHSILDKIKRNRKLLNVSKTSQDADAERLMKWSMVSALSFRKRQKSVISALKKQAANEPSEYLRGVLLKQIQDLQASSTNAYLEDTDLLDESIKSFIQLKSKGYSMLELEEIKVESERIETHEDKMYLVSRLVRNIEIAQRVINKVTHKSTTQTGYASQIEELNKFLLDCKAQLKIVNETKVKAVDYKVFVKYPVGDYEE